MMPPHQESSNITIHNSPASIMLTTTRTAENFVSVHAEPSTSAADVVPCSQRPIPSQQQPLTPLPFSVLSQSLRPITLKFEEVAYSIHSSATTASCFSSHKPKPRTSVLNGVSGVVRPGELLAMLGPSGSGKTTLLTALGGRLTGKMSGTITYNGRPFSSSVKRRIGFVAQDDVLYPHLTVLETLTYAALLKLPKKLTTQEKIEQAELIIVELGLARCRNNVVGGPLLRGVSGGERKRVSVGLEMLVNPSLLMLDEPTSGLDSTAAHRIMVTLRGLARGGRTVITTIHQPSSGLYRMFDKVLVLSEGYPIYWGKADQAMDYFGYIGFTPSFNFLNPADFLLDLANGIAPDVKPDEQLEFHGRVDHPDDQNSTKQFLISSYKKNIYPTLKADISQNLQDSSFPTAKSSKSSEVEWNSSWWEQFKVLLTRGVQERKHESFSGLRIFQVMSVSVLSGLLWWHSDTSHIQDQVGLLFFFSIFWGFFPLFNAIFTFPQERPMLIREGSSGMYRLSSYYIARTAGDLPMELVLPTIFVAVTYWMGGLKPSLLTFVLTLSIVLLNVLVSQALGLAMGAILMDVKQATTLASVTMLVFLLVGGYYIHHMPDFIAWLKYISFSHYCYKLLVGVQYSANELYECEVGRRCKVIDFPAIKHLGLDYDNRWWDAVALIIMLAGYRLLAYVGLRVYGKPRSS
ncbi:ABC transporter G family member 21 [Hibiscus syriacus]|uniref:ABC transporter G family member 21 n=1 Tax=Hibiscus syriacus TaxID=106335 RepID=UPI001921462B|nr:ABC transporter G family member 21 [Hibiscus syriacus]